MSDREPLSQNARMTAQSRTSIPLTVIILTYNEESNIEACINGMASVDDIVIVDSLSADGTVKLAQSARPDVRVFTNKFKDFGDQRNWALDNVAPRHQWILFVDADEFCSEEFLQEVAQFIANPTGRVGAYVAGKNYFLGRWLKHTTMYPSYQLRLLKLGEVRFRKEGHGQREVTDGELHYLTEGWRHEGFSKGLHQWIERHNQYSTDEVELILRLRRERINWLHLFSRSPIPRRRALKQLGAKLPFRPLTRFLYMYILRRGFLDGYAGFVFCSLRFAHDIHIVAKLAERTALNK
ncbi:MAG: glycosyltransferase family 2 protein [Pseudomonadota bacterium]